MRLLLAFPMALLLLTGCSNRYEMYMVAGHTQSSFSNKADLLFVVDNSLSMWNESGSLALNFTDFIQNLVSPEGSGQVTETLIDATNNYIQYVSNRGRYLDYQIGITTTSVDSGKEFSPGEEGTLAVPVISEATSSDVASDFQKAILCDLTVWAEPCKSDKDVDCIPYVPDYVCGEDPLGVVSWEYLDCVCGEGWEQAAPGTGNEEHLEATWLAMCRTLESPPRECYYSDDLKTPTPTPFAIGDEMSNPDFRREDSSLIVVIVTDEGDTSRRLPQGEEDPTPYLDLFQLLDQRISFVVVGPNYDPVERTFNCNSGQGTTWGTVRLQTVAEQTGGFFKPIETEDGADCVMTDFAEHLNDLGELLNTLLNVFPLQTTPDPSTIRVFVDDLEIDAIDIANCILDDEGEEYCGDGWVYDPSLNSVSFEGNSVPDYNADVQIYYRPLAEPPRSLPF